MNGQQAPSASGWAFRGGMLLFGLLVVVSLSAFMPPLMVVGPVLGGTLLWLVFSRPVTVLGIVLAIMPFHFLAIILGQFFGLPYMTAISVCTKEIPLLLLTVVLWHRNSFRPTSADWCLFAFLMIALIRAAFGGVSRGLLDDVGFILPYLAGRMTVLTAKQERLWAKCAVGIVAVLSVLGAIEVFFLGEGPRKLVYVAVSGETEIPDSFHATAFTGLRAAATMEGPLGLGALCMIALIIWWVYFRNPIPAGIVFAGLVCSLTRSAWVGTTLAISVLAVSLGQTKRLGHYALLAFVTFILSVPILGVGEFLSITGSGQEDSAQGHGASLLVGLDYVASHPLGTGPESIGPRKVMQDDAGLNIESSYLTFAAKYGVLASLGFLGFFLGAIRRTWNSRTQLGYAVAAILVGFGTMMFVLPVHMDLRLACWVWFPVGLSLRMIPEVRGSMNGSPPAPPGKQ